MILFVTEHQDRKLRLVYLGRAPLLRLAEIYVGAKGRQGTFPFVRIRGSQGRRETMIRG